MSSDTQPWGPQTVLHSAPTTRVEPLETGSPGVLRTGLAQARLGAVSAFTAAAINFPRGTWLRQSVTGDPNRKWVQRPMTQRHVMHQGPWQPGQRITWGLLERQNNWLPRLPPFSPRSNYRCLDIPAAESFLKRFAKKKHLETVF